MALRLDVRLARALLAAAGRDAVPIPSPVRAYRLDAPLDWVSSNGSPLRGEVGHWAVEFGSDLWTLVPEVFAATYVHVEGGLYAKRAGVRLVRLPVRFVVESLEGLSAGEAGDFLAGGPLGDVWALPAFRALERYRLVS